MEVKAGANVSVIPATKRSVRSGAVLKTIKELRVAAYCRVSTGNDEQQSSYIKQKEYYTKLITSKEGWQFAGIYADEAITGTSRAHRKEFNRMIDDAVAGKIDYIVTKSISRFARNTVDTLECVRQLRQLSPPVGIFFEKENIDTLDSTGELFLTILSAMAQDESRSIGDNVRWSIQKNFQQGKPTINLERMLGYDLAEDGSWMINEQQSETVKEIYGMYLCGMSAHSIAKALNERGFTTVNGKRWKASTILIILKNEKYTGDLEMQKNVTVDMLAHIVKKNTGEAPKYYIRDHHPAIIDRESWEQVQKMLEVNSHRPTKEEKKPRMSSVLFRNLYCGRSHHGQVCGQEYQRHKYNARTKDYTDERCLKAQGMSTDGYEEGYFFGYAVWRCGANVKIDKTTGEGKICPSDNLYECAMQQSFMEMLYRIKADVDENGETAQIYREFKEQSDALSRQTDIGSNEKLLEINQRITEIQENIDLISRENDGSLDTIIEDFKQQIRELEEEKEQLLTTMESRNAYKESFDFFIKQLSDLPTKTNTGQIMNINTVTVDYEHTGDSASVALNEEQIKKAPDLLPFDKYFYHTHIIKGTVYGDVIEYTTTFGMKLKSVGNSRTMKSFLGFRRQKSDGTYEPLLYTWQVINNSVQYRRKKK